MNYTLTDFSKFYFQKEMMQVRQVLEKSEKERLTERKEKLSALQNMIKLTKDKTDIEEELDERKKADTKESSDKVRFSSYFKNNSEIFNYHSL